MPFKDSSRGKEYRHNWYLKNKVEISLKRKAHYEAHKDEHVARVKDYEKRLGKVVVLAYRREHNKIYNEKLRREVLAAYGNKCACCGVDYHEFLALDHVGGWGGKHRKEEGWKAKGKALYLRLKKQGYPKDRWQLLCINCNQATRYGATCPHKMKLSTANIIQGMGC